MAFGILHPYSRWLDSFNDLQQILVVLYCIVVCPRCDSRQCWLEHVSVASLGSNAEQEDGPKDRSGIAQSVGFPHTSEPWTDILSVWLVWFQGQTCRFDARKHHETFASRHPIRICQKAQITKRFCERDADEFEAQSSSWWRSCRGVSDLTQWQHPGVKSCCGWRRPWTFAAAVETCWDDYGRTSTSYSMANGPATGLSHGTSRATAAGVKSSKS